MKRFTEWFNKNKKRNTILAAVIAVCLVGGATTATVVYSDSDSTNNKTQVEQKADTNKHKSEKKTEVATVQSSDNQVASTGSKASSSASKSSGSNANSSSGRSTATQHTHHWVYGREDRSFGQIWTVVGQHEGYVCNGITFNSWDELKAYRSQPENMMYGWANCNVPEYGWREDIRTVTYEYCAECGARKE